MDTRMVQIGGAGLALALSFAFAPVIRTLVDASVFVTRVLLSAYIVALLLSPSADPVNSTVVTAYGIIQEYVFMAMALIRAYLFMGTTNAPAR